MIVTGTNLSMIRGDSETIIVSMRDIHNAEVPFVVGDIVYLTVKENLRSTKNTFQEIRTEFDEGSAVLEIDPEHTKGLRAGEYIYDVQLTREDGSVTTIIKPSKFTIEGDVTND